jgi:hypothetical protein
VVWVMRQVLVGPVVGRRSLVPAWRLSVEHGDGLNSIMHFFKVSFVGCAFRGPIRWIGK